MSGRLLAYLGAVAAVAAATVLTGLLRALMVPSISLLFFPAIVIPAMYGGYGPGLCATVLSTVSMAYFFVPPLYSFDIGLDDALRLVVFTLMALATASIGQQRRRAELAQTRSLEELHAAIDTLRKVSGWPLIAAAEGAAESQRMLAHAANAIGASSVLAQWEAEDEPWVYVATASHPIERHPPTRFGGADATLHPDLHARLGPGRLVSAPFQTEHLVGQTFFAMAEPTHDIRPTVDVVAREVGNSLDQLYLSERDRQLAVREDRIRLSRDLHDGVLQSLTGIRLELQGLAETADAGPLHDRLLASERALALEQRELRRFIDGLKPGGPGASEIGSLAEALAETSRRLTLEWHTAVTVRINPSDLTLPPELERGVRLMIHEAVINALKHANPTRVNVRVDVGKDELAIVVTDDGTGFPFKGTLDHEALAATGPASLRERVGALSGRMSIASSASGSRIDVTVPLRAARAAAR